MILARLRCLGRGHLPIDVHIPHTRGVLPLPLRLPVRWRATWLCARCHNEVDPPK